MQLKVLYCGRPFLNMLYSKTIVGEFNCRTFVLGQHKNNILPLSVQGYIVIFVQRVWGIYYICCL